VSSDLALLCLVVAVGSGLVSGVALLVLRRAALSGALLVATSLVTLAATLLEVRGHPSLSQPLFVAAAGVLGTGTLMAYPSLRWRHPVDFLALCVVGGSGLVATVLWRDLDAVGAFGILSTVVLVAHTWWRIERSKGRERRALIWMSLSVGVTGMLVAVGTFATQDGDFGKAAALSLAMLAVGVLAAWIVITRTRMYATDSSDPR
jgi:hypothetical protein